MNTQRLNQREAETTKILADLKVNDFIQFHGIRIATGNPVKGRITMKGKDNFHVKLDHDIEGLVNVWYKGEIRAFSVGMITNLKKVDHKKDDEKLPAKSEPKKVHERKKVPNQNRKSDRIQ